MDLSKQPSLPANRDLLLKRLREAPTFDVLQNSSQPRQPEPLQFIGQPPATGGNDSWPRPRMWACGRCQKRWPPELSHCETCFPAGTPSWALRPASVKSLDETFPGALVLPTIRSTGKIVSLTKSTSSGRTVTLMATPAASPQLSPPVRSQPTKLPLASGQPTLPKATWKRLVRGGEVYYWNTETNETTYKPPPQAAVLPSSASSSSSASFDISSAPPPPPKPTGTAHKPAIAKGAPAKPVRSPSPSASPSSLSVSPSRSPSPSASPNTTAPSHVSADKRPSSPILVSDGEESQVSVEPLAKKPRAETTLSDLAALAPASKAVAAAASADSSADPKESARKPTQPWYVTKLKEAAAKEAAKEEKNEKPVSQQSNVQDKPKDSEAPSVTLPESAATETTTETATEAATEKVTAPAATPAVAAPSEPQNFQQLHKAYFETLMSGIKQQQQRDAELLRLQQLQREQQQQQQQQQLQMLLQQQQQQLWGGYSPQLYDPQTNPLYSQSTLSAFPSPVGLPASVGGYDPFSELLVSPPGFGNAVLPITNPLSSSLATPPNLLASLPQWGLGSLSTTLPNSSLVAQPSFVGGANNASSSDTSQNNEPGVVPPPCILPPRKKTENN